MRIINAYIFFNKNAPISISTFSVYCVIFSKWNITLISSEAHCFNKTVLLSIRTRRCSLQPDQYFKAVAFWVPEKPFTFKVQHNFYLIMKGALGGYSSRVTSGTLQNSLGWKRNTLTSKLTLKNAWKLEPRVFIKHYWWIGRETVHNLITFTGSQYVQYRVLMSTHIHGLDWHWPISVWKFC